MASRERHIEAAIAVTAGATKTTNGAISSVETVVKGLSIGVLSLELDMVFNLFGNGGRVFIQFATDTLE